MCIRDRQRRTDVRYYDKFILDGWVYDPAVKARVKRANPDPKSLRVPTLLIHGEKDTDVPFSQAETFFDRAARNAPDDEDPLIEKLFLEGEPHGMGSWSHKAQKTWLDTVEHFLKCHLKPWDFDSNPHGDVTAY